jgi:DNA-directed RNA polymerase specialized sigma24 family protein
MDRASENSVSQWLLSLRHGSPQAAEQLWDRYFTQIVELAERQLLSHQRRVSDGEDIALSVLDTLIRGAAEGRFPHLHDRRDLWCLLFAITKQKTIDVKRHEGCVKRGGGLVKGDSIFKSHSDAGPLMTLDNLCGEEPTPDFVVALDEQHQHLMKILRDDVLRCIAAKTLEGYSTSEIATHLKVSVRAVQRKLNVIRATWSRELLAS